MSDPERTDWRIEALAEIEDIRRRLFELKHLIATDIRHDEFVRKIMTRIMADDEAAANFGAPCSDIHPDYAGCTHECYVPPDEVDEIERCGE